MPPAQSSMAPESAYGREIPKRVTCPDLTSDQVREVTALCFEADAVDRPQAILVFGTNIQHEELADTVVGVLAENEGAALILTGGRPAYVDTLGDRNPPMAESETLEKALSARIDLSRRRVILETTSRNTLENVRFAEDAIKSLGARRITFLAQSFAVGRSAMTVRAVLPTATVGGGAGLNLMVGGEPLLANTWSDHAPMRDIVWGEFLRIVAYSRRGDIDPGGKRKIIADIAGQFALDG